MLSEKKGVRELMMNYRKRSLERKLLKYFRTFSALTLTGARQTGKSTMLKELFPEAEHIVFDPIIDIGNARQDPELFLDLHKPPLILDEIQYAPELLPVIKRLLDINDSPSQYILTGSQHLSLLKNISESLAGRVIVLDLWTLSLDEKNGCIDRRKGLLEAFIMSDIGGRGSSFDYNKDDDYQGDVFNALWRGGYPRLLDKDDEFIFDIHESYVKTYIERDIRVLADIHDLQLFTRFFMLCAALTSQEINYSQLGRELGITPQTASRWINILKGSYQWFELPPYHGNSIKRLSGKPKGYLTDTGLACYLQKISSTTVAAHPMLGSLFESHVVMEIVKKMSTLSVKANMYHWRTYAGGEVDLILEYDGVFKAIEMKCKSRINKKDIRGIVNFRNSYPELRHGTGFVIYAGKEFSRVTEDIYCIPYSML